jgi:mRNA interferase HigB
MNDVVASVSGAQALNGERVRFPIGGGKFRLIAGVDFRPQAVFVKFIGTHQAYDRIDALTVNDF